MEEKQIICSINKSKNNCPKTQDGAI
jgi:hypothetical protein